MAKEYMLKIYYIVMAMLLVAGCKQSHDSSPGTDGPSAGSPQRPFHDESQFIVETIASDLATQIFYAQHHTLPDTNHFSIHATEKPDSPFGAPVYRLKISVEPKQPELQIELNVNGPIWSPELYQDLAAALAKSVGLGQAKPDGEQEDTALLLKLTDGSASAIESEDQNLSLALEGDFNNFVLHEKAAVLLGAFALREHSGFFYDTRLPLCQMTAHLTLARMLAGGKPAGINGQMAEVMLFTLMNNRADAVEKLDHLSMTDGAVTNWTRALRARLTGDYRPLAGLTNLTMLERMAWFEAYTTYGSPNKAWIKVTNEMEKVPDFTRIAEENGYDVESAHDLLRLGLPLELKEIATVYQQSHGKQIDQGELVRELNQLPENGFSREPGQPAHVRVIGWGQWARFLQAHLCQTIVHGFNIYQRKWGLRDEAQEFATKADNLLDGLKLYPSVRTMDCTNADQYHAALDDAARLAKTEPESMPPYCWNDLWYRVPFAEVYQPLPYDRLTEWFKHDPPPGTAYDPQARMQHGHLMERGDAAQQLARLHELSPWDRHITAAISKELHKDSLTFAQATNLFGPFLAYDPSAMRGVAYTVTNQPDVFIDWMSKAAAVEPSYYFNLGDYVLARGQEDSAAKYFEKGQAEEVDSLVSAEYASWRIKYYLKHSQQQKAQRVADAAGEVYSGAGLKAKAEFFEATGKYASAFEWYAKEEERYNDSAPLIAFCNRYKTKTGDTRYDAELKKRTLKQFPHGLEKVSLQDFHSAPTDGVLVGQENNLLRKAGMKTGDVIVALNGIRTHTFAQYTYIRETATKPELTMIVWQANHYLEIKASPPNHRFGVVMVDYPAK